MQKLRNNQLAAVRAVLSDAFFDHEWSVYVEPDPNKRRKVLDFTFSGTVTSANWYGHIQCAGSPVRGVLVWYPPRTYPMSYWQLIKSGGLKAPFITGLAAFKRLAASIDFADTMKRRLYKDTPFWYLPFAGVAPEHRGKGIGHDLIHAMHGHLDGKREISCLEANSDTSRRHWEKYGYQAIHEEEVPGGGLYYWFMARNV
jgi:GNAT superfamily N-acetyltransferase